MNWSKTKVDREDVERAARMYPSGAAAARALGIDAGTFMELCRKIRSGDSDERKRRLKEEDN